MKKILIGLLLLFTVLVSVSCGEEKPKLKYKIVVTKKWTATAPEYHYSTKEYVSVTTYNFTYHYETIYPEGAKKDGRYCEGFENKSVSYPVYNKYNVGDEFTADAPCYFSFPD